jgi:hypothetical protein
MKYTYEDWLNVKVVLNSTKNIKDEVPEEKIASLDDFDMEEVKKIQEKQKNIFNELLEKEFQTMKNEFCSKLEISDVPRLLIRQELNSIKALFGEKFICDNDIYRSPIKGDNKVFLGTYYRSMMNHKNNSIVSGIVRDFDEIPSPNSRFFEKGNIPPEVMISVFFKMFNFVSKINPVSRERKKPVQQPITNELKYKEIDQNNQTDSRVGINFIDNSPTENNDDWNTFFKYQNEYDFFLMCKKELPNRGKKSKKMNDKSELTKYSNIFHFFMEKGLIRKGTKHSTFIEYLIEEHDAIFPKKTISIPAKYSNVDRGLINGLFKIWQLEKQK